MQLLVGTAIMQEDNYGEFWIVFSAVFFSLQLYLPKNSLILQYTRYKLITYSFVNPKPPTFFTQNYAKLCSFQKIYASTIYQIYQKISLAGIGLVIVIAAIVISMAAAMYMYTQYQTNFIEVWQVNQLQ